MRFLFIEDSNKIIGNKDLKDDILKEGNNLVLKEPLPQMGYD